MLRPFRASDDQRKKLLAAAREAAPSTPQLLTLADGLSGTPPRGFVHDLSRSELGRGQHVFAAAREAFRRWEPFALGWVQVVNGIPDIAPGQLVAVEAHTAGFRSVNISRIVEVADSATRFGFLYATTAYHVEEGQERFLLEFDSRDESVSYLIEAVSRPRHVLARIAYPFTRAMQHRFARDSHARIQRCVRNS